jgi:hypothetical protein
VRTRGVVDAGMRRHGGQAQGGAQADAVEGHFIDVISTAPRRAFGVSPEAFTLFASFSISAFSRLSSASRPAGITEQWWLVQDWVETRIVPVRCYEQ